MPKKKTNYWTEQHEELVILYNNETEQVKRSVIYNQLRPAILIMVESILRRYFKNFLSGLDETMQVEILEDCEIFLVEKVFVKFNHERAKAYAYLGTSAKHWFTDWFKNSNGNRVETLDQTTVHGGYDNGVFIENYTLDVIDESKNLHEQTDDYLYLKNRARLHIKKLMEETTTDNQRVILNAILELLKQTNFNKHYAAYFLLSKTKKKINILNVECHKMGLNGFWNTEKEIEFYLEKIENYKKENGINESNKWKHKDFVKDALNIKSKLDEKYQIQDKRISKQKRDETKRQKKETKRITSKIYSDLG